VRVSRCRRLPSTLPMQMDHNINGKRTIRMAGNDSSRKHALPIALSFLSVDLREVLI
jgi:hypothetical protein